MSGDPAGLNGPLIDNAVKFLKDSQVSSSPLSRKVSFLESKGLSPAEIDEALRQASSSNDGGTGRPPPPIPNTPPPRLDLVSKQASFEWGWFALLIALFGSAGVALSQSSFMKSVLTAWHKVKSSVSGEDPVGSLKQELEEIKNLQESLKRTIEELKGRIGNTAETMQASQNHLYRELSQEIEEIRDQFALSTQPISIAQEGDKKKAVLPVENPVEPEVRIEPQ